MEKTGASWIEYNSEDNFPIQNLPYGVAEVNGEVSCFSRISQLAINLAVLENAGLLDSEKFSFDKHTFNQASLNKFISLGKEVWGQTRSRLTLLFSNVEFKDNELVRKSLVDVKLLVCRLPVTIGDYTDFYSSKNHAFNIGSLLRPTNPLQPNYVHLPVGYHGRSSTVVVDGTEIVRPRGQVKKSKDEDIPVFSECKRLDIEAEMGVIIGKSNKLGQPIKIGEAFEYVFGFVLLNDWSARDIQAWEYVPLGPFTAKNFATTISAWIITKDALEPFRFKLEDQDPKPLKYLQDSNLFSYDIPIEILAKTQKQTEHFKIGKTNYKYMYWTMNQQITHHTVTGCSLNVGDLLGSGTISGTDQETLGCFMEMNRNATIKIQIGDEERLWLNDGDEVILKASCQGEGFKIGFGDCSGKILPAVPEDYFY